MKRGNLILFLIFILTGTLYYLFLSPDITGDSIFGKREVVVLRAVDGDTILVSGNEKVRMLGVNTPEKGEFGAEADFNFTKQLENQTIILESVEKDKYGRTLGYIYYKNELFNELLLKKGFAHFYAYSEDKYTKQLKQAEQQARENDLGIWQKSNNSGCLTLKQLKYVEEGERCTNKELLEIENNCNTLQIYLKDDTSKGFHYNISKGTFTKNYSCKFNDEGDSLYIWDKNGLILFYRYP